MIDFRRLFVSLTAGALLLVLAAGQAGAAPVDDEALEVAAAAANVGFEAANALFEDAEDGSIAATPGLQLALESISTLLPAAAADHELAGIGRSHAQAVLGAILAGDDPDALAEPGEQIAAIAEAYKALKAQRAEGAGPGNAPVDVPAAP